MSPRRWVRSSAFVLGLAMIVAITAAPAMAQLLEAARSGTDLSPDPSDRSPRLLGMGRLTLVIPDRDNRIDLWNFARNPAGIYRADSTSTIEFRPNTGASSSSQDFADQFGAGELQTGASRTAGVGYEIWRRPKDGTAYGLVGSVDELRLDSPYEANIERRSALSSPSGMPVITGRMPYILTERMRYAVYGLLGIEDTKDEFRAPVRNSAGEYIDEQGELQNTPDTFTPDAYFVRRWGGGLSFAYDVARSLLASIGGEVTSSEIKGSNVGERYISDTREVRPRYAGEASLVGRLGRNLTWAADGRGWTSKSSATWDYSISPSGGPGPSHPPVTGRGDLFDRKETGTRLRVRASYRIGKGQLGGSYGTLYTKTDLTPSPLKDLSSFNLFREDLYVSDATADTLLLPNDVRSSNAEARAWEAAGGMSWPFPLRAGILGAEYHFTQQRLGLDTGPGAIAEEVLGQPKSFSQTQRKTWDIRSGLEIPWSRVLATRVGYIYRSDDLDALTAGNEFVSQTATMGLGLRPLGADWALESGYAFEWGQADYGSPLRPRFTRQQLAVQVRWDF